MTPIGIDPSLTGLAVCVLQDDGTPTFHEFKNTTTACTLTARIDRYKSHAESVRTCINEYAPAVVLIEGYSMGSKGSSILTLAEFGIVLRMRLQWDDHTLVEVPPTMLKKFATGKGQCKKAAVVSAISKRYGVDITTDDQADAYALARLCGCVTGVFAPSTKFEESVARDVGIMLVEEQKHNA